MIITLGILGPFNNSHDSSSYLTLNWFLFGSLLKEFCLEKESFALRKESCLEKESFALKKKVLPCERKSCHGKESFVVQKKVFS